MHDTVLQIALIGILGIGAQWIAWRTQLPAIVILLATGFIVGPALGIVEPSETFGELLTPIISVAVAIILFEGGLTLNFTEIRETSPAVRRVILYGAPATWGLAYLAAHHLAGLSEATAAIIGGIMVVTGPTVIMPLLRQAALPKRPASLLRWEAIIADPIGALFAIVAYETTIALTEGQGVSEIVFRLGGAILFGAVIAFVLARLIAFSFVRGLVPEFLKAPLLLVAVLAAFATTNMILDEAGLLTVTIMGIVLANTRLRSLEELRRFKEVVSVILVSGLFIILTATTTIGDLASLGPRDFLFLAALLFLIRPAVVMTATIGTKLTLPERLISAWIAPRGVVAVAVSGFFAQTLILHDVPDAERLVPLTFLVVVGTVILHGFSIRPLAVALKLSAREAPGILFVGGSPWTRAFARKAQDLKMPVLLADSNWNNLAAARREGVPVYFGEILSEAAEHRLDMSQYAILIAATDNDAYNALVCTDLAPEMGRSNVFQLGRTRVQENTDKNEGVGGTRPSRSERHQLHFTVGGGNLLPEGVGLSELNRRIAEGWEFTRTRLTEEFDYSDFAESRHPDSVVLFVIKPNGRIEPAPSPKRTKFAVDDYLFSFGPPAQSKKAAAEQKQQ